MAFDRLKFWIFYRIGFTPWDGHQQSARLVDLIEGAERLPAGRALDIGCGTGDASIYLAKHGWNVTAIDFVEKPLERARQKAAAAGVSVRWLRADATKLASYDLGSFDVVVDNGCLHGLSQEQRDAYVQQLTPLVRTGGRMILAAFPEKKRVGPAGIDQPEIERRFASGWQLLSGGIDSKVSTQPDDPIAVYDLRRR